MSGIYFNTGVSNQKGTPGIISDIFANRPTTADTGTLFVATDTGAIYSYTGAGWTNVTTGGGGGTPGIDDVLAVGQLFTANRDIGLNGFNLRLMSGATQNFAFRNDGTATIGLSTLRLNLTSTGAITLGRSQYFGFEYSTGGSGIVNLGFFTSLSNTYLSVLNTGTIIKTLVNNNEQGIYFEPVNIKLGMKYLNSYLELTEDEYKFYWTTSPTLLFGDFNNNTYKFGDWLGINTSSAVHFEIVNNNSTGTYNATLNYQGNPQGLVIDFATEGYTFGDAGGNKTSVELSASGNIMTLRNTDPIDLNDNGSNNMLSGTASGSSGQHLIIRHNGNTYKIALLNP
jgi:hypothetical protein